MEFKYEEGYLTIRLPERIDARNATNVEEKLFAMGELREAKEIMLDADRLIYISSMGLRVILKLKKAFSNTPITITNVSNEIRNILEDTGFASYIKVFKKMRNMDLHSLKLLGSGMYGSVYRINEEQILKVFHNLDSEREIQRIIDVIRTAFTHGIPTIMPFEVVTTEKGIGVVLELLNAEVMSLLMHDHPKNLEKFALEMAKLAKTLSNTTFEEGTLKNRNDMMAEVAESATAYLTPEEIREIKNFIELVPRRNSGVHGDFHARNIMVVDDKPFLIDMDEFSCGHPVWDIAGVYRIYQGYVNLSKEINDNLFELKGANFEDFYFKMIGLNFKEADLLWKNFFNEYFSDYSAEEKDCLSKTVEFYSTFMILIFTIERCHLAKQDPAKLARKVAAARHFLKGMQAVGKDNLGRAFEVWK